MEKGNNISVVGGPRRKQRGTRPKVNKEYMSITNWHRVVRFSVTIQGKSGEINHMYNIPTYETLFMILLYRAHNLGHPPPKGGLRDTTIVKA